MDPSTTFCPNPACPDKGRVGGRTSGIHKPERAALSLHDLHEAVRSDDGDALLSPAQGGVADDDCADPAGARLPAAGHRRGVRTRRAHRRRVAASGGSASRRVAQPPGRDRAGRGGPGAGRRDPREGARRGRVAGHGAGCRRACGWAG